MVLQQQNLTINKNNNVLTETESISSFSPFVLAVETVPDPGTLLHRNRRYALPSFPSGKLWFQALELWFLLFTVIFHQHWRVQSTGELVLSFGIAYYLS